jgi:DNA-binding response OmpR family regulator
MNIQDVMFENDGVISENYAEIFSDEGFNIDVFRDREEVLDYIQTDLMGGGVFQDRDGCFN